MSVLMVIQIWCHEEYNKYLCHVIKSIRHHHHWESHQRHLIYYSPHFHADSGIHPAYYIMFAVG
jgi:hypothetical protein